MIAESVAFNGKSSFASGAAVARHVPKPATIAFHSTKTQSGVKTTYAARRRAAKSGGVSRRRLSFTRFSCLMPRNHNNSRGVIVLPEQTMTDAVQ